MRAGASPQPRLPKGASGLIETVRQSMRGRPIPAQKGRLRTLSDCCNNFALTCVAAPNLVTETHPNLCLPQDEARTSIVGENSASPNASPQEDMIGQLGGPKNPDFSRRIQDELPFLRKIVRRWYRDRANADDLIQE